MFTQADIPVGTIVRIRPIGGKATLTVRTCYPVRIDEVERHGGGTRQLVGVVGYRVHRDETSVSFGYEHGWLAPADQVEIVKLPARHAADAGPAEGPAGQATEDAPATPCIVCATQARVKGSAFFATRGLDWPLTQVAGHPVHKACASDAEHLARMAAEGQLVVDGAGVGRWASNGRAVPGDCAALAVALGLAPGLDAAATGSASHAEAVEAVARYRAAWDGAPAGGEEVAEMRATFGPGAEIVNVVTGRRTRL